MKAAEQSIVEGSKRLAKAIAKNDFTEAHVASALIDGARKKLEKKQRLKMSRVLGREKKLMTKGGR